MTSVVFVAFQTEIVADVYEHMTDLYKMDEIKLVVLSVSHNSPMCIIPASVQFIQWPTALI